MSLTQIAQDIRRIAVKAVYTARSGHPGGALSIADILAVLYFDEMNVRPEQPSWSDRDRFVLSKGHACPALYAALALKGFFTESEALQLRNINSRMEGHPDIRIPGIDAPSGSLGMGLSQSVGMAMGAKHLQKTFRSYVILGDGDMQEGNTWEAVMCAGHHRLDNLVAFYDSNKLQGDATVKEQMDLGDVAKKIREFGWNVIEIDGHNISEISGALKQAKATKSQPTFIVADTIKGKGVGFMEGVLRWHGSVTMTNEELTESLAALGE